MKQLDLTGVRYGRLTIVARAGLSARGETQWVAHCDCGNAHVVKTRHLRHGGTQSCGCMRNELASARLSRRLTKHGLSRTRAYNIWHSMMARCYDPRHKAYPGYGARGIKVCERWHSVEAFVVDMDEPPTRGHSIDRIDNTKGYEPGNCRWATAREQAQNRSSSVFHEHAGLRLCLSEWANRVGISPDTLAKRLIAGYPFELAITQRVRGGSELRRVNELERAS